MQKGRLLVYAGICGISVPFRISDYAQMVQLTYKLCSERGMHKEKDKKEVFVAKQSHADLHI